MKILITSALPYANGPLHFGHIAGAYLPGDCYARFQRLKGHDVLYLCGSDEYGVAITLTAEMAGRTPKEHVDIFHSINQRFFEKLNFSFDHYSRTTWEGHAKTVQEFYHDLHENGYIEEKVENHLYSEKEGRFLADRYVIGICPKCGFEEARGDECQKCAASYEATDLKNPRSKLTNSPLSLKPSTHLYLRFDLFKDRLKEWIDQKKWKESVLNFALSYIQDLKPRAITRDSSWGVPVPGFPNKVFYVWFDAPIGYITAAQEWAKKIGNLEKWKEYWCDSNTKLVHFIGKDNIPFHAVFFPAMLMGQNRPYKLPDEIPANEFFLLEGRQFSKSDGWTIDLEDFFAHYTTDQIRYCIAANAPETADSEFSWKDFQMRCNAELLGKFGNFIHRVMVFAKQHCQMEVPQRKTCDAIDLEFLQKMKVLVEDASIYFSTFQLRKASQTMMELASLGNGYFDLKKPWVLNKNPESQDQMRTCISLCLECIQNLALISSPIIPETSQKIWDLLGNDGDLSKKCWDEVAKTSLPEGRQLNESIPLFRKVENDEIEAQIVKLTSLKKSKESKMTVQATYKSLKETIQFDQFEKLDLRIAQVLEAVPVPKSKKLFKLTVDLGFEKRTVVSGIALQYTPEQLIGKKVILLANLKPATLMGIESQGMILAGDMGDILELPMVQNLPPGSSVS